MSLITIHEQRKAMVNVLVEESSKSRQCPICFEECDSLVQACEVEEERMKRKEQFSPHYVCRTCFDDGKHAKGLTKCLLCFNFQQTMDRSERGSFIMGMPCRKIYNNTPYNELAAQVNSLCKAEEELRRDEYAIAHAEAEATRKAAAQATREKRASQESQDSQASEEPEVIEVEDGEEGAAAAAEGGQVVSPEYSAANRAQESRRDAEIERMDRMAAIVSRAEHESAVEAREEAQEKKRKRKEQVETLSKAAKRYMGSRLARRSGKLPAQEATEETTEETT